MALLPILIYPDTRLREVAEPVTVFNDALKHHIKNMFETMYHQHACGLAATQVGLNQRILTLDDTHDQTAPLCMVNPVITEKSGKLPWEEGCLSFPGIHAELVHAHDITVDYQDEEGQPQQRTVSGGLLSACIQHEIDHLDGVLFIDHLSSLKRNRLIKKMEKIQRIRARYVTNHADA